MNKISQIILTYLKTERVNYALMINGAWGSGKTHYLKESLKPEMEKETGKKLLYVSLNGVSSVEDIGNRLLGEKFKMWSDGKNDLVVKSAKVAKVITTTLVNLGKFRYGVNPFEGIEGKDLKDILMNFSNHILCFDDLERISPKIDIEEVLGYINTEFIEHNHIKTLIISDESKIEQSPKYKIYKEKLIGRTVTFEWNISQKIDVLFSSYISQKEFYKFIDAEKEYITYLLKDFREDNLRTLFFCFDSLEHVVLKLKTGEREQFGKSIIIFTMMLCIEYKEKGELYSDYAYKEKTFFYSSDNLTDDEKTLRKLNFRYSIYFNDSQRIYFASIYTYIKDGFLDISMFQDEMKIIIQKKTVSTPAWEICLNKLIKYKKLSEKEYDENIENIFTYLEQGKYNLPEIAHKILHQIYYEGFKNQLITKFKDIDELKTYFLSLIQNNKFNPIYNKEELHKRMNYNELQDVFEEIKKADDEVQNKSRQNRIRETMNKIKESPKFLSEENLDFYVLLKNMDYDELLKFTIDATIKEEEIINESLYCYHKNPALQREMAEDVCILEKVVKDIKIQIDSSDFDKIQKKILNDLISTINEIIKDMQVKFNNS